MFSGSGNIFCHIPDSVALTQYNTILRLLRKISIQSIFNAVLVHTIFKNQPTPQGREICAIHSFADSWRCTKLQKIPLVSGVAI
jgi:hypothetical protein